MLSKIAQDWSVGVQVKDRPADTDARSLMWEWCHRLTDREAAVQAVIRHLGEAPMHAKDCLHAKPREHLQLTWVEIVLEVQRCHHADCATVLHLHPLQSIMHEPTHVTCCSRGRAVVLVCEKLCLPGRFLCHAHNIL